MKNIDTEAEGCFNSGKMSDSMKPLPDSVLEGLLRLPLVPASRMVGSDFKRVRFPRRNTLFMRRLWCAVPSAHKHEELGVISPEAFNVVGEFLIYDKLTETTVQP